MKYPYTWARLKLLMGRLGLAGVAACVIFLSIPEFGNSQTLTLESVLAGLGEDKRLGAKNAPVSIVEFSDFQCSFCRKFWIDTLPQIKESYIKKGQVRFTYRHFAILGRFSGQAAQASECASEQQKFWPYHDKLFAKQGGLAFSEAKLKQYAQEIKINGEKFGQCLASEKFREKVEGETNVAAAIGLRGTPAFFVNQRLLVGAQPFDVFRGVIEEELKANQPKEKLKP